MISTDADFGHLYLHPFFLILVWETLPVWMLLDPFFCRNECCGRLIELAECLIQFL